MTYPILRALSEGSTATVSLAQDPESGAEVILKQLHHPHHRATAEHELALLRFVDLPGVPKVLDHGLDDTGRPWLRGPSRERPPTAPGWCGCRGWGAVRITSAGWGGP